MDLNIMAFDIMIFLVPVAVQIGMALLYIGIYKRDKKIEKMNKNYLVIKSSGVMVWPAFFDGVICTALFIFGNMLDDIDLWIKIIPILIAIFCFIVFFACITEKMIINGNKFVVYRLFRKRKEFSFEDIARIDFAIYSGCRRGSEFQIIGIENKILYIINGNYTGCYKFISLAIKRGIKIKYKEGKEFIKIQYFNGKKKE